MTRKLLGVLIVGSFLFFVAAPLFAHHSFDAEYDRTKPIKFTGTIAKVDWMNPHVYVYVDVKTDDGRMVRYSVEGGAPNALFRQGVRKEGIKIGEVVSVDGYLSKKDGANYVNGRITTQAGKGIFQAPTGGGAPQAPAEYQR